MGTSYGCGGCRRACNETCLIKPGKLSDEEFEAIRNHPVMGARILGNIKEIESADRSRAEKAHSSMSVLLRSCLR